jgi:hypothetical protein
MHRNHRIALVFLAVAVVAIISISQLGYASGDPFGPIHVAANRSAYNGNGCPVEIIFTATINFVEPHGDMVFNYHWERSDGGKTSVEVVRVPRNKRSVTLREKWRLGAPGHHYDASVTLFVNSGNSHLSETSRNVSVTCK